MIDAYQSASNHLRKKYFQGDYMGFGMDNSHYVLGVNGSEYKIPIFKWTQTNTFIKELEEKLKYKYPEIFL